MADDLRTCHSRSVPPLVSAEVVRDASQPNAVLLHVYKVRGGSALLRSIGWGAYHVGVQVYGREYQYGRCASGKGIGCVEPRQSPPHIFHEEYCLGNTRLSVAAVAALVDRFGRRTRWRGDRYDILQNNCMDFAHAFCAALLPPHVRVQQALEAERAGLVQVMQSEQVVVEGRRYAVPAFIPGHVDRLARYAAGSLSGSSLRFLTHLSSSVGGAQGSLPRDRPATTEPAATRSA